MQGPIGKGAPSTDAKEERVRDRLQAPDYLNQKERMIFEKLDSALEPIKLEVCHIRQGEKKN